MKTPFTKNTLIAYKGGGYDRCFWEWNYAYIGSDWVFHSILATGRYGCKSLGALVDSYANEPKDFTVYKLADEEDCRTMGQREPVDRLIYIAKWFIDHGVHVQIPVKCDECGEEFSLLTGAAGVDAHDCGGIATEHGGIICSDCESAGTCRYCGEYVGFDHIKDDGYCEGCAGRHPE